VLHPSKTEARASKEVRRKCVGILHKVNETIITDTPKEIGHPRIQKTELTDKQENADHNEEEGADASHLREIPLESYDI
jgi:hypothetical protein